MLIDEKVSRLIHEIYDASLVPEAWDLTLQNLATLMKARMTSLLDHRPRGSKDLVLANFGIDSTYVDSYEQYYFRLNIYFEKSRPLLREGLVVPHEMYCSDEEILRSEYYNDFQRKLGLFRVLAAVISATADGYIVLSVNRSPRQPPFSETEMRLVGELLPHIRRSLEIRERLRRLEAGGKTEPSPADFALKLRLTKAEAEFATLLASGLTTAQICDRLNIRISTARTHLRHLYEKTRTSRQAELVGRLLRA